jgi:hypothetical protein
MRQLLQAEGMLRLFTTHQRTTSEIGTDRSKAPQVGQNKFMRGVSRPSDGKRIAPTRVNQSWLG